MSKDPAFLFYSNDFLTGVSDLTFEERGQYITLLCLQHQKGHLTKKMIELCCGNATADVLSKFKEDENGCLFNERLDIEIEKRRLHSEKQSLRAKEGWEKRRLGNATASATAMPLENENVNEDVNNNKNGVKFNFKKAFLDLGVEKHIIETFLEIRKKKKMTNSELAFNRIKSEIDKSGLKPNDAIKIAAEKSWAGFDTEWLNKNNQHQTPQQQPKQPELPMYRRLDV